MISLLNREIFLTVAFLIFLAGSWTYLFQEQKRNTLINISDLFTADNGRIAATKFFQAGTFFLSSWVMLFLTVTGKMTDVLLIGFCGIWAGAYAVNKAVNNNASATAAAADDNKGEFNPRTDGS